MGRTCFLEKVTKSCGLPAPKTWRGKGKSRCLVKCWFYCWSWKTLGSYCHRGPCNCVKSFGHFHVSKGEQFFFLQIIWFSLLFYYFHSIYSITIYLPIGSFTSIHPLTLAITALFSVSISSFSLFFSFFLYPSTSTMPPQSCQHAIYLKCLYFACFLKIFYLFIFRERGMEGERQGEKH